MVDYQILTKYSDRQVVMQMRLNMDIDLERSVDTNYSTLWDAFTVEDALDAVKTIVPRTTNVAVYRKEFDCLVEKEDETIQEFVTRLKTCGSDCSFVCPFDDARDLADYHLFGRL